MSEAKYDGGPAFPMPHVSRNITTDELTEYQTYGGMTLRAYFAGKAMQGDWAAQSRDVGEFVDAVSSEALTVRARLYLRAADALVAELAK